MSRKTGLNLALRASVTVAGALISLHTTKAEEAASAGLRFTDVSAQSGIDLIMTCGATPSQHILEVNGGGIALFDYDRDGDLDLFLANGATMADPERGPGSRIYANRGDGIFSDATRETGIELQRWAMGVTIGDYDADGFEDLYVTCFGPNVLLRNEGGRRFVDVTTVAGVGDTRWGTSAAFGDVDNDGDLDLFVANYLDFAVDDPPGRRGNFKGVTVMPGPAGLRPQGDVLYENLGDGTFRNATSSRGCVPERDGYGLGTVIFDMDSDGDQDIFVGNDSSGNFLFHNRGSGHFEEVAELAGIARNYDGTPQACMGIGLGDVDGNGYPDVFVTNFSQDTNTLYLNLGTGLFEDRTAQYGLGMVSLPFLSWGTGFYDFDLDGDEDLFIASGHVYPEATLQSMDSEYEQPALLFERRGGRFERRSDAGGMFARRYRGRATAFGDIDGDGDVDVVMTTLNGPVHVFRNDTQQRAAIVVEPRRACGSAALGSRVELGAGILVQDG
jgi:hypothetical protein